MRRIQAVSVHGGYPKNAAALLPRWRSVLWSERVAWTCTIPMNPRRAEFAAWLARIAPRRSLGRVAIVFRPARLSLKFV